MELVKERLKFEIDNIQDEELLAWVLSLLTDNVSNKDPLVLTESQRKIALIAEEEHRAGLSLTTEELLESLDHEG